MNCQRVRFGRWVSLLSHDFRTHRNSEPEKELLRESPKMADYVLGGVKPERGHLEQSVERR